MIHQLTQIAIVAIIRKHMALNTHITCENCDAVFKLQHDMDAEYYPVRACPFCGESLDEEHLDDVPTDDDN
jgi:hypothetical protein